MSPGFLPGSGRERRTLAGYPAAAIRTTGLSLRLKKRVESENDLIIAISGYTMTD